MNHDKNPYYKKYCSDSGYHMLEYQEQKNWKRIDDSIIDYSLRMPIENFDILQIKKIMLPYRR